MWKIEYKKVFLKELSQLPLDYRSTIEKLVFEDLRSNNPFSLKYLEKLKGYKNKYKVRVGNYRVGITINKNNSILTVERVAHRKEIYRMFP